MREGDVIEIEGNHYEVRPITWFRCQNCHRTTTTGLCGCSDASQIKESDHLFAWPTDRPLTDTGSKVKEQIAS